MARTVCGSSCQRLPSRLQPWTDFTPACSAAWRNSVLATSSSASSSGLSGAHAGVFTAPGTQADTGTVDGVRCLVKKLRSPTAHIPLSMS